ncbi:MAG: proline/glycine betaine ABC transporter permease [Dongiaceae bacterium]
MPDLDSLFKSHRLPLDGWIQAAVDWLVHNLRPFFLAVRWPVARTLDGLDSFLQHLPVWVVLLALMLGAWRTAGWRVAIAAGLSFLLIGFLGLWAVAMTTVAMVTTSVLFCVLVGIPVGILAARSEWVSRVLRPVLDAMQTTPTFVYLVPIVMLFGIGNVPAVIATIIVALPPMVRLTDLGIRQVRAELVEAGYAFGCTPRQVLLEVQIPLALPSIMAGLNQSLMLSLSMVVVAALIGAGGLGLVVYQGINRLDVGLAGVAGLAIVLVAISLDRITQAIAAGRGPGKRED